LIVPYFFGISYKFPAVKIFKGDFIYNPYNEIDSSKWLKANFHAHSRVWLGLTNGSMNKMHDIVKAYEDLGYDIIGISDYMRINKYQSNSKNYIPVYEHGYGVSKSHQLVIGSDEVNWFDYALFQTLNCKQEIFNKLKTDANLIAIVHPSMNKAYSPEDFRYLTNYDCLEILRHDRNSLEYWDTALSNGHYVTLLADDDNHEIQSPGETGRCYNMINSKTSSRNDVINSIKKGNSYGVDYLKGDHDFESKKNNLQYLAKLESVSVKDNIVSIRFSRPFNEFKFVGQNGKIKKTINDSASASYEFSKDDTYIRAEIMFENNIKYYLNPFIRYDGEKIEKYIAEIDYTTTYIYRSTLIIIPAIIFIPFFFRMRKKRLFKNGTKINSIS
jgi:hypothetical protein